MVTSDNRKPLLTFPVAFGQYLIMSNQTQEEIQHPDCSRGRSAAVCSAATRRTVSSGPWTCSWTTPFSRKIPWRRPLDNAQKRSKPEVLERALNSPSTAKTKCRKASAGYLGRRASAFQRKRDRLYKATVLATRINLFWGLGWKGSPCFLMKAGGRKRTSSSGVWIPARLGVPSRIPGRTGRAITGWTSETPPTQVNSYSGSQRTEKNQEQERRLPTVAELFPEIISPTLDKRDKLPSCSAVEALERQEPFVNQVLAYQALAMLSRLFRYGRLSHQGGFVNLRTGRTTSRPVDPAFWERTIRFPILAQARSQS